MDKTQTSRKGGKPRTGQLIWRASGWYARVTTTIDGERIRVSKALGTLNKSVARRKLARLLETEDPKAADTKRPETFAEAAERIYEAKRAVRPAWAKLGLAWLKTHAMPEIGAMAISDVQTTHLNSLLFEASKKGLSRQSVKHIKQHLSNVFRQLRTEGAITVSPVLDAEMPDFADRVIKERAVLTDAELFLYLAWHHPEDRFQDAVRERQVMACIARLFGGVRVGDITALTWQSFDLSLGAFAWGFAPRAKTRKPQRLVCPEMLRPILKDHWERAGRPATGLLFPVRRVGKLGDRIGEQRHGASFAKALRRDLQAAFVAARERGDESAPAKDSARWRELFTDQPDAYTRRLDWHSFRRLYVQKLADADVNAQSAAALSGHSDLSAHARYLHSSNTARRLPDAALPAFAITIAQRPNAKGSAQSECEISALASDLEQPSNTAIIPGSDPACGFLSRWSDVRVVPGALSLPIVRRGVGRRK